MVKIRSLSRMQCDGCEKLDTTPDTIIYRSNDEVISSSIKRFIKLEYLDVSLIKGSKLVICR